MSKQFTEALDRVVEGTDTVHVFPVQTPYGIVRWGSLMVESEVGAGNGGLTNSVPRQETYFLYEGELSAVDALARAAELRHGANVAPELPV